MNPNKSLILLVEDDRDIQENLRFFLELEGYNVDSVYNGQEAIDYLKAGNHPQLILLDVMMPILNGYQFIDKLHLELKNFSSIPIILLSATTDLAKMAQEKNIQFLTKPLDLEVLASLLNQKLAS